MNTDTDSHPTGALPAVSDALAEEAMAWFAKLRGEAVSAVDRACFDAWLRSNPAHRQAYEEVAAFWDSPGFSQALGEASLSLGLGKPPSRFSRSRHRARLALALAASLAVFAVIYRPAALGCWNADYCAAVGEAKTVALEDGSHVTLNTGSAIRVESGSGSRHVRLLRGEAFFDVSPDARRPFQVDGHYSLTRVKGTRFLVREDQATDTVTVVSGVVEVSRDGQEPAVLRENDQITVDARKAGGIRKVQGSVAGAWMKGKAVFDNAPLAEVVAEIARYRRGTVLIKGDGLRTLKVSGRFDIANTDQALESLAQTLPIRVYRLTPWLVVIA